MTRPVQGIQSITMQYLCMMTDDKTYPGDDFEKYRNRESLGCAPGTNTMLQFNYTSETNSWGKRLGEWLPEAGKEELDESDQKVQTPSFKRNKCQGYKVQQGI